MSVSYDQIEHAVKLLKQNDVVAFPTETVYGLGACINSVVAIKKIFSTKARPFFDPLIVHVSSLEQAKSCFAEWHTLADLLAKKFWPGPLTLVMPKSELVSDIITSGLINVGVRMPQHPTALALIDAAGVPLAAPSANKFGKTSPTTADHVKNEFGDSVYVIDGAASDIGIESTVLLVKKITDQSYQLSILRKGAVVKSQIETYLANYGDITCEWIEAIDKKESPGHMKHHYMPEIPFVVCKNPALKLSQLTDILNERLHELPDVIEDVKIVKPTKKISKIEFLRLANTPEQAAREFYSQLRAASSRKPDALCFIQIPGQHEGEMWESLFDRMYKAASLIID